MTEKISGVLVIEWELICQTELVVRSGNTIIPKDPKSSKDIKISDLYVMPVVHNGILVKRHIIPASSLRGTLRSYLIQKLVPEKDREIFRKPEKIDDKEKGQAHEQSIVSVIGNSIAVRYIIDLFGIGLDTGNVNLDIGQAGRISFESEPLTTQPIEVTISNDGEYTPSEEGISITVRNPLDRLTHASVDQGLHRFLEFSRGTVIKIRMRIKNPTRDDLRALNFIAREIETGLIRFGALGNIGLGRIKISNAKYSLWKSPVFDTKDETINEGTQQCKDGELDEVLSEIWRCQIISPEKLDQINHSLGEFHG